MATREAVLQALYDRIIARVSGLVTKSRAYVDPNRLTPEQMPALMLIADHYDPKQERGRPTVWTVRGVILVYTQASENPDSPETPLNLIIDQVEAALQRDPQETVTDASNPTATNLGGLCSRVSISGAVDLIPGEVGGQAAAMIPVEVLM